MLQTNSSSVALSKKHISGTDVFTEMRVPGCKFCTARQSPFCARAAGTLKSIANNGTTN
jgi:hypothetical protein